VLAMLTLSLPEIFDFFPNYFLNTFFFLYSGAGDGDAVASGNFRVFKRVHDFWGSFGACDDN
jgi:hypothetical protein